MKSTTNGKGRVVAVRVVHIKLNVSHYYAKFFILNKCHYYAQIASLFCSIKLFFLRDFPRSIVETTHSRRQLTLLYNCWKQCFGQFVMRYRFLVWEFYGFGKDFTKQRVKETFHYYFSIMLHSFALLYAQNYACITLTTLVTVISNVALTMVFHS